MTEITGFRVRVTNANEFAIQDAFDGVPYIFESKGKLTIPKDAAAHIFGWTPEATPDTIKKYILKRFGWNTPAHMENKTGEKYFRNLKFDKITYRLVETAEEFEEGPNEIPVRDGARMQPTAPRSGVRP